MRKRVRGDRVMAVVKAEVSRRRTARVRVAGKDGDDYFVESTELPPLDELTARAFLEPGAKLVDSPLVRGNRLARASVFERVRGWFDRAQPQLTFRHDPTAPGGRGAPFAIAHWGFGLFSALVMQLATAVLGAH